MKSERNYLTRYAWPKLKEICKGHNLEFYVVDMRWGITDNAMNEHKIEKLCLTEVERCFRTSLSTAFVTILGDRYGYQPIPTSFSLKQWNILKKHGNEDFSSVDKCYKLDENLELPVYILLPIKDLIKSFGDDPEASKQWKEASSKILNILRKSAEAAFTNGAFTVEERDQFYKSGRFNHVRVNCF